MFKVEIETDNAAFAGEDLAYEINARLRELALKLANMTREDCVVMCNRGQQFVIRDSNGNRIGVAAFSGIEDSEDSEDE